jgi:hypothetical protein
MSDQYRHRSFPPDDRDYNHAPQHQQGADDPLAELARLIGQTDPYSSFGRQTAAQPAAHVEPAYDNQPDPHDDMGYDPHHDDPPLPAWMRARDPAPPVQTGDDYGYSPASQEQTYNRNSGYRLGYEVSRFDQPQQEASYAEGSQNHYADSSYDQGGYRQDAYGQGTYEQSAYAQDGYAQGGHDQTQYGHQGQDRYDQVLYGEQPRQRQGRAPYPGSYEPDYAEEAYDQGYGEPEQQKRRGGMMTVAAVLALAVIGTAGAYAYRSIAGSPRSGEPPIIKADASPSKVVPAKQSGDKQIYDRVGDKSGERMVSREEQPVDVDTRSGGPRVVFPPLTQNPSPPSGASVSPAVRPTGPGVANGTLSGEVPRRIRTISIHPADQTDVTSHTPAAAPPAPAPVQTMAARAQVAPPQAAPSNAPMALAPQAAEPRSRVASLAAPAGTPTASGSYVQVSSQRSEADAMTSYRILQGKYPGILGSRHPTVRRADLGSKGVYYRALVGPFVSTEEATHFCVSLQSAGGKCLVQRN